jgi:hypothetical protein
MPIRVAPTRSANRSILAKPLPSLPAVVESIPLPSSSTALHVSVALCASMPMTLSITTSLVQMRHDAGHRSDNNPSSSTRLYQARTGGPEIGGGRLRSKPAAHKSLRHKVNEPPRRSRVTLSSREELAA